MKNRSSKQTLFLIVIVTVLSVVIGFLYNRWGQFSDIRGFYGMRYIYGDHPWPFSEYIRPGNQGVLPPVEYPALTGILIWLLTFLVPNNENAVLNYYYVNAFFNAFAFLISVVILVKIAGKRYAYYLVLAPAVITALNRNWDIWAVLPLLASIYFFSKEKWLKSAALLGVAIATKFFPAVLLLPITIYFARERKWRELFKYFAVTGAVWFAINLPIFLVDAKGWAYFYEFSLSRGVSDGSVFDLASKFGIAVSASNQLYYLLNIAIFSLFIVFMLKNKRNISLVQSAFLVMFAFTLFGKQYSMQYVLWIAPLAVIGIAMMRTGQKNRLVLSYIGWQLVEMLFHHAYYQNLLARVLEGRGSPLQDFWSNTEYAVVGLLRYASLIVFVVFYVISLNGEPNKRHNRTSSNTRETPLRGISRKKR